MSVVSRVSGNIGYLRYIGLLISCSLAKSVGQPEVVSIPWRHLISVCESVLHPEKPRTFRHPTV